MSTIMRAQDHRVERVRRRLPVVVEAEAGADADTTADAGVEADAGRCDLPPQTEAYIEGPKLAFDRAVATVALIALSPLLLVIAILVRIRLGSPVLFRQQRVGLHGKTFEMLKFRTMLPDRRANHPTARAPEGEERRETHKSENDPRHTPLGRWLRAYRLDELPQLVHVCRGEMSLVGPRPEVASVVERYEPWQHRRHAVRPGLTGLWQISEEAEKPQDMHLHTEIDIRYVETCSWRADARILLTTLPSMLATKGV